MTTNNNVGRGRERRRFPNVFDGSRWQYNTSYVIITIIIIKSSTRMQDTSFPTYYYHYNNHWLQQTQTLDLLLINYATSPNPENQSTTKI